VRSGRVDGRTGSAGLIRVDRTGPDPGRVADMRCASSRTTTWAAVRQSAGGLTTVPGRLRGSRPVPYGIPPRATAWQPERATPSAGGNVGQPARATTRPGVAWLRVPHSGRCPVGEPESSRLRRQPHVVTRADEQSGQAAARRTAHNRRCGAAGLHRPGLRHGWPRRLAPPGPGTRPTSVVGPQERSGAPRRAGPRRGKLVRRWPGSTAGTCSARDSATVGR